LIEPDVGKALGVPTGYSYSVVGAAVLDDDYLVLIGLRCQKGGDPIQTARKSVFLIVGGDDDGK